VKIHLPAVLAAAMSLVVVWSGVTYLHRFYGSYNLQPEIYHGYHVDLLEACDFLRDRLPGADAVYCTAVGVKMPYVVTLVGLKYDPRQWFKDEKSTLTRGQWDVITSYGKMHFLYRQSDVRTMSEQIGKAGSHRIYLVLRPQEAQRLPLPSPIKVIRCGAEPTLLIYELNV
jgi:hypothetical protein